MIIHDPGNTEKITVLYAFVSEDENGNQGLIAAGGGPFPVPLVTGSDRLLSKLLPLAITVGQLTNKKVKILKFTNAEVVDLDSLGKE